MGEGSAPSARPHVDQQLNEGARKETRERDERKRREKENARCVVSRHPAPSKTVQAQPKTFHFGQRQPQTVLFSPSFCSHDMLLDGVGSLLVDD